MLSWLCLNNDVAQIIPQQLFNLKNENIKKIVLIKYFNELLTIRSKVIFTLFSVVCHL